MKKNHHTISSHEILFYHRFYYVYCIFFSVKTVLVTVQHINYKLSTTFCIEKKKLLEHLTNIHEEKKKKQH